MRSAAVRRPSPRGPVLEQRTNRNPTPPRHPRQAQPTGSARRIPPRTIAVTATLRNPPRPRHRQPRRGTQPVAITKSSCRAPPREGRKRQRSRTRLNTALGRVPSTNPLRPKSRPSPNRRNRALHRDRKRRNRRQTLRRRRLNHRVRARRRKYNRAPTEKGPNTPPRARRPGRAKYRARKPDFSPTPSGVAAASGRGGRRACSGGSGLRPGRAPGSSAPHIQGRRGPASHRRAAPHGGGSGGIPATGSSQAGPASGMR